VPPGIRKGPGSARPSPWPAGTGPNPARFAPLFLMTGKCQVPRSGKQDRYPICGIRGGAALPPGTEQPHHRKGKVKLVDSNQCPTPRGLHAQQYWPQDGIRTWLQVSVHQVESSDGWFGEELGQQFLCTRALLVSSMHLMLHPPEEFLLADHQDQCTKCRVNHEQYDTNQTTKERMQEINDLTIFDNFPMSSQRKESYSNNWVIRIANRSGDSNWESKQFAVKFSQTN